MHQSFVATAPTGPGNSGASIFLDAKPRQMPCAVGPFLWLKPLSNDLLKSQQVNLKILLDVQMWNQKLGSYPALRGG